MKKTESGFKILFYVMLAFGILSPCALFLLLPQMAYTKNYLLCIGLIFWGCFLLELTFTVLCSLQRKKIAKKNRKMQLPGILTFFSNPPAAIADVLMIVLTIWTVIAFCIGIKLRWLVVCSVALCILCYQLHSILNGVNYRILAAHRKKRTRRKKT